MDITRKIIKDNYGGRIYITKKELQTLGVKPGDKVNVTIEVNE